MSDGDWEVCVLCKRIRCLKHVQTVIGPVCRACWQDAHPESAPYWADHARRATPGQAATQRAAK